MDWPHIRRGSAVLIGVVVTLILLAGSVADILGFLSRR
jgi:hypothetical protein